VKSWECRNRLCPDRSIYNRGKRYSFKGLITQEAIENPANLIPVESVRRWRRDVLQDVAERELSEMLLRHYSIAGDVVVLIDTDQPAASYGRSVVVEEPSRRRAKSTFWSGPFFARYGLGARNAGAPQLTQPAPQSDWSIEEGDSRHVLARIDSNTFDLGVTSPPYFNAREYSQWPNIYCYMYDMAAVHEQVLRVLKPGAVYAFNVFDYFDNERTITFSAMGQKRLSLSALFVDLFRRIGFRLVGNLVWDKGDVEGKRAFNAGNFSPFYQSPLNCWEHVLLFQKPGIDCPPTRIVGDRVLPIKPVVKMVRGENRLGHSAPFPQQLPEALMASLSPGSFVLDPFGGSGTTARAGITMGMRTLLVEQSHDYVKLARSLTEKYEADLLQREAQLRLV
jgi:DNA modification methylase